MYSNFEIEKFVSQKQHIQRLNKFILALSKSHMLRYHILVIISSDNLELTLIKQF